LAGYLRVDPYGEFLRSRSAARGRGLVYFGFLLRLAVTEMTSDILLKNHTFIGRKGGQGDIRQHRGYSLDKHCEVVSRLQMID
jgi:hypothetical protein